MKIHKFFVFRFICSIAVFTVVLISLYSCSSFNYKTYDEQANVNVDDPEPNYNYTLDKDFQDFTNFMFIGNRIENFGTFFNTYYNAKENFDDAYDDYITRVLGSYGSRLDSINTPLPLSQQATDLFQKAIEKSSKVLQFHKSSAFSDRAVLLIGKCYYYLGDYVKAERKFSEFASKLSNSPLADENMLFYSRTQIKLGNSKVALENLNGIIQNSRSNVIKADAYQTLAEYHLSKKDYPAAIENYKKAIEFSRDSEFKAQMQFLLATVIAQKDNKAAVNEFDKVLDFSPSFDLEFFARLNRLKFMILTGRFSDAQPVIENMRAKYRETPEYLAQVDYLQGVYWEQKNDFKKAFSVYRQVMIDFPKTEASSGASYQVAQNFEKVKSDYLNAFRYYRYSNDEYSQNKHYYESFNKIQLYKKYFDLRSVIVGKTISTDYDSVFIYNTQGTEKISTSPELNKDPNKNPGDNGNNKEKGKDGGLPGYLALPADSLTDLIDSAKIKEELVAKAKFELAELFDYDFKLKDSSEYYYLSAFEQTGDYDFKSKVLYALAGLYRSTGSAGQADEILRRIVKEFPLSPITNEAKKELNMPVDEVFSDASDSLYNYAENKFFNADYTSAMDGYRQMLSLYPTSIHAEKVKYSIGWLYENVFFKPDSSYMYYTQVIASNPKSEYAKVVQPKVKVYDDGLKKVLEDSIKANNPQVDSSKTMDTNKTVIDTNKTGLDNKKKDDINSDGTQIKKDETPKQKDPSDLKKPDINKPDDTIPKNDDGNRKK